MTRSTKEGPAPEERPAWLSDLYGYIRCPACNHRLRAEEMKVLDRKSPLVMLALECARCHAHTTAAMVVLSEPLRTPPLVEEDVLAAHELLKRDGVRLADLLLGPAREG